MHLSLNKMYNKCKTESNCFKLTKSVYLQKIPNIIPKGDTKLFMNEKKNAQIIISSQYFTRGSRQYGNARKTNMWKKEQMFLLRNNFIGYLENPKESTA